MKSTTSALLNHPYDAVVIISSDNYTVKHANDNTSDFINKKSEEIIGSEFFSCFSREIDSKLKKHICQSLKEESVFQGNKNIEVCK